MIVKINNVSDSIPRFIQTLKTSVNIFLAKWVYIVCRTIYFIMVQPDLPYQLWSFCSKQMFSVCCSRISKQAESTKGVCECVDWGTVIRHRSSGLSPAQAGRKTPEFKCNFARTPLCKENYHLNSVASFQLCSFVYLKSLFRDDVDLD